MAEAQAVSSGHCVEVSSLRIGESLSDDIVDRHGVLLLAAGSVISERFLERLRARGIERVTRRNVDARHDPRVVTGARHFETEMSRRIDGLIEQGESIFKAGRRRKLPKLSLAALRAEARARRKEIRAAVGQVKDMADDILKGRMLSGDALGDTVAGLINVVGKDASLALMLLELKSQAPDYIWQHGVNVALVAMRVAMHLGYDDDALLQLGIGSVFQDVGMLRVPADIWQAPRKLTDFERMELERHPIHTIDLMEKLEDISTTAMVIAYQAHERMDGTGYPRQRGGMFIHPLARVVNAADTFVAITSDRPHRPAATPYHGMETLLHETRDGRLDADVVRAFLDCMSLFPIGSYVRLSNGMAARVIRANGSEHTRPIVLMLDENGNETDKELDLMQRKRTTIVEPLIGPANVAA